MNDDSSTRFTLLKGYLRRPPVIRALIFALCYFGMVQLGFILTFPVTSFLTFWPAGGFFVAALLLTDRRDWPALCLGAYVATSLQDALHGRNLLAGQFYIAGNCLEALAGAWLVRRYVGQPSMARLRDVFILFTLSAALSSSLCATVGVTANAFLLANGNFLTKWLLWWSSNLLGILVVAPLMLNLLTTTWKPRPIQPARIIEAGLLTGLLALVAWIISHCAISWTHLNITIVPLVVWAALRFKPLGASVFASLMAFAVVWVVAHGPTNLLEATSDTIWPLQLFLSVVVLVGMVLAAVLAERTVSLTALMTSNERSRVTLMSVGDAVISTDCHGLVDLMNPVAETLTGWPIGEARGRRLDEVFRIINEDTRRTVESPVERVLREGVVVGLSNHTLLVAKDGTERPIADSGAPIRNEQNDIVGVVLVFRDQTVERAASKALRESERLLQEAQNVAGLGSYTLDVASGLWRSSPTLDKLFGIEESFTRTVEGWLELIHPDDQAMMTAYFTNEVLGQGRHFKKEYRIIRRNDRSERWVYGLGKLDFDSHGRILRMIGTIQDITERKRAEAVIADRGRFVESLVNMAPDILYIYDLAQKKNTFSNTALQTILGYSAAEIQGMGSQLIPLLMHPDDLRRYLQVTIPQYAAAKDGEAIIHEYRMRHKSGQWRWLSANETIYQRRPDGSPRQVFGLIHDVTEGKRLEEELRASQRKFRNIVEASPMGMHLYEVTGDGALVFTGANPSADRILGVDHTQFIGKTIEEAFPALIHSEVPARYREAALHGTQWHTEQIDYAEGAIRGAFEVVAFQTEPGKMAALFNDITERKRSEHTAARLAQEWQITFDSANDAIWMLDRDQYVMRANRTAREMFPTPAGGSGAQHCWEIVHRTTAPIPNCPIERARRSLRRESMELQIGERWYQITADPILDSPNQYAGAVHIVRDITDRIRTERALHDKDDFLQKIVETVPGVICSFRLRPDGTSSIPFGADRLAEFYGLAPGTLDADASPMLALIRPEDAGRVRDTIEESGRSMAPWRCEWRVNHLTRGEIWVDGYSMPLREPDGGTLWHGVVTDITDRKRADAAQDALQAELTQAQKMESVGRLAGGVAHDFNNLLMGIMGYTELCLDQIAPDHPIRGWLEDIATETGRSEQLTRQLLAFARKQTIAPIALDINDAIENILKLLRRVVREDIAIQWQPGPAIWHVQMDPAQVDQILLNLCVNSRDATATFGQITIETRNAAIDAPYCAQHSEALPGDYVIVSVTDTGSGMDAEALQHIFEPFFTTKPVGAGTGLGLSTVYGIVRQNGGFIEVRSDLGKGTTFEIYLPRLPSGERTQAESINPGKPPRGTETVLLVEDERSVRVTTQRFLEDLGYTIIVAENAGHALRLAAQHSGEIHLLIADVIMPGMSGRDLAKRLDTLRPAMKTLYISGFTADVIAQRGILDPGIHFLAKPFSRDDLARKVREVLAADENGRERLRA